MADIVKPVILDETGKQINQKLAPLPDGIEAIVEALNHLDIIYYVENE